MRDFLKKLPIDTYMLLLIATVVVATVLPVSGAAAKFVSQLSSASVALLFFLYGAKLKTQASSSCASCRPPFSRRSR